MLFVPRLTSSSTRDRLELDGDGDLEWRSVPRPLPLLLSFNLLFFFFFLLFFSDFRDSNPRLDDRSEPSPNLEGRPLAELYQELIADGIDTGTRAKRQGCQTAAIDGAAHHDQWKFDKQEKEPQMKQ